MWRNWFKAMPLTRESYPKQYLKLASNDNHSLLQKTYKRISEIENIADPIIVCNENIDLLLLNK